MPSLRQKKLVESIAKDPDFLTNRSKALIKVGYSPQTAESPTNVLNSQGVQALMAKASLVISDDECVNVVANAIRSDDPKLATDTVFKWLRMKYPEFNPFNRYNIDKQQIINVNSVEEGSYLFMQEKTGFSRKEINKRLGIKE